MLLSSKCRPCLILLRKSHGHAAAGDNYYKILGISPSASQAEIKSAYFELSKKHHPDRNQGSEESAKIFRLIKTAYEVLGSEKTRLQYDKERIFNVVRKPVYSNQTYSRTSSSDDAENFNFHNSFHNRKPFRKYSHGKTTFFDFDAWYEGHYGKDSAETITFKEPKQFKYYTSPVENTNKKQNFFRLETLLLTFFYLWLLLVSVKFTKNKAEKR